jgi:hypothetical protein
MVSNEPRNEQPEGSSALIEAGSQDESRAFRSWIPVSKPGLLTLTPRRLQPSLLAATVDSSGFRRPSESPSS